MSRLWLALRSTVYAILFVLAWGSVDLLCRRLDPYFLIRLPRWVVLPGVIIFVLGAALSLTTIAFFVFEGRGTPAVFDPPRTFVPHGPYRIVRNPMYIGGVSMLCGLALYLTSFSMLLYGFGALLVIHIFVIYVEEPGLRKRFGSEYEDYCRSVPRWIPRFT